MDTSYKITKFKSENLFGETRQQERQRLQDARIKAILAGKSNNVSYSAGTTRAQRANRTKILKDAGLPVTRKKYSDVFSCKNRL